MCGILSIINNFSNENQAELKSLVGLMSHRGPDGSGVYMDGAVRLGHRRLAIIDTADSGRQPMSRWDLVVTYNGEIYNYIELKELLKRRGYKFSTTSDTEVLLAMYREYGVEMFEKLNGMWAFVLHDKSKNEIVVSRDRLGKKPLYYMRLHGGIVLCSEIKPILRYSKTGPKIDYSEVERFLKYGQNESTERTIYSNIYRYPPGHYSVAKVEQYVQGVLEPIKYWDLNIKCNFSDNMVNLEEYAHQYRALLESSVRLRLRSDRQVGTALSGGLDSSSVAYFVDKVKNDVDQKSYSCVYRGIREIDESKNIESTIQLLNIESHYIDPSNYNIREAVSKIAWHMELPYDGTLLAPWFTYALARSDNTCVTLDGQGADELFAGYRSYIRNIIYNSEFRGWSKIIGLKQRFDWRFIASLIKLIITPNKSDERFLLPLNVRLLNDVKGYLSKHLMYGDRLSMAHGVESRLPFMDVNIVEWAFMLPAEMKIRDGWTKYISRYAMREVLPESVVWSRHKLGFPSPEVRIFREHLSDDYKEMIKTSNIYSDTQSELWTNHEIPSRANINKIIRQYNMLKIEKVMCY